MSRELNIVGEISHLTLSAVSGVELREGIAAILQRLVSGDCIGVMSAMPGHAFQATLLGTTSEPFVSQAWRYTLEVPRELVMRLSTGFTRSSDVLTAAHSQFAFQREYFAPNGISKIVARNWTQSGQLFCVGLGRKRMDFSDSEVRLLDSIFPHLAVAMRVSQLLAQDTEAKFAAFCESYDLSLRQREIAPLLARGLRNGEIATLLHVKPNTVRNYIADLFRRAKVSSRAELTFLMSTQSFGEDPSARRARELLKWIREPSMAREVSNSHSLDGAPLGTASAPVSAYVGMGERVKLPLE